MKQINQELQETFIFELENRKIRKKVVIVFKNYKFHHATFIMRNPYSRKDWDNLVKIQKEIKQIEKMYKKNNCLPEIFTVSKEKK